jgi:hypothetical protein
MCSNAQQTGCTENSFKRAYEDEVLTPECGANSMWVDVRMDGQMHAGAQLAKAAVQVNSVQNGEMTETLCLYMCESVCVCVGVGGGPCGRVRICKEL